MRQQYYAILKDSFYSGLVSARENMGLTRTGMAQILAMDERSYRDLDHGLSCCSALTFARFLIYCCEDPVMFLVSLQLSFEAAETVKLADPRIDKVQDALSYRVPLLVTESHRFQSSAYSVCPRCHIPLDREFVSYCDRCGQQLDWSQYR